MTDLAKMAEVTASGARKETPLEKTSRIVRVMNDDDAEARHAKTARLRKARFDNQAVSATDTVAVKSSKVRNSL
ncbi:hypothetical protein [Sulfitobacter sp.]|uniref:hypothetical protein n=1 Tax=Sulfitobacter sp. TaxID=1903071 RepID=UPI003EF568DF